MKKTILLFLCLFICSCSTTKTLINYNGNGLLKEYKVKEHKEVKKDYSNLFPIYKSVKNDKYSNIENIFFYVFAGLGVIGIPMLAIDIITTPFLLVYDSIAVKEKNYSYNVHAKISGQIVNTNGTPISNQNIQFGNKAPIYSNINGNFEKIIDHTYKNQYYPDKFILNFNNGKSNKDVETILQNGSDILINNPHEISIQLDKEQENLLYLENNNLKKKEIIRNKNKDEIVLSSQTFSAKYYRDKIKKEKEDISKKLKQNNISYITAEEIMLNSNGNLRDNRENILNAFLTSEKRLKETGIKDINVKGIVLIDGKLNYDWELNLEIKIHKHCLKQARVKLEKQTGYTYYDSEVEEIVCDKEYTHYDYDKHTIKKVKSNWKELVNKEIKKQQQLKWEQQQKIKRWKQSVHVVQQQLNRCPNCYRYSLTVSLLMKTGDPNHTWLMMLCPQCEYYNEELSGF